MKKTLKIFEKRKEIVNKLKDEAKADIIKFLLENPFNTIDFTSNTTARGKYNREKIGNSITEDDLTNEELKDLYFSKEYNGNFFNEIIYDKIFRRKIYVKASKDSDFGSYYKNKYMILTNFLENVFEVKTLENMSYYESYEKFLKTLSLEEAFEKLKEKKYRLDSYIVEGIKMVKEAISENQLIELIAIREDFEINFDTKNIKIITISSKVFNDISDVKTPQGILAVIKKKPNKQIETNTDYILALDSLQDPGNMGTIIRTADSANINQIIINKTTVDPYSPKVIRSTMGAIYRMNIIEVENLESTLKELQDKSFKVITTDLKAEKSIYDINYNRTIVVIGNEANGVSQEVLKLANERVIIPMLGKTESLNASIAASIMIYEHVRQKIQK